MSAEENAIALGTLGSLTEFPLHTQQEFALASATNVVVLLGGNHS